MAATATVPAQRSQQSLFADLSALTKPRITLMVILTTLVGYVLAAPTFEALVLLHTLVGTAILASGSSVLNQVIERNTDARMQRTANRPLPAGRMRTTTALWLGVALGVVGTAYLATQVNVLTAALGLATLLLYVCLYTPMKRKSSLATLVGAIPGAMPPMMGCSAATNDLGMLAWALFGILFLWQMPHFLAIAWLYRSDYQRGGFPMLSIQDSSGRHPGRSTALQMVLYAAALIPVSLLPSVLGFSGPVYLIGAVISGVAFLAYCFAFGRAQDSRSARKLLLFSVLYLPVVLTLMVVDHILL